MANSIPLSPKHGVNPSITCCFWCGKSVGITFMGRIKTDKRGEDPEAPKYCVADYEPCDECREKMNLGVTVIECEVSKKREGVIAIQKQPDGLYLYPTSSFSVVKPEAINRLMQRDDFTNGSKLLCDVESYRKIFVHSEETE